MSLPPHLLKLQTKIQNHTTNTTQQVKETKSTNIESNSNPTKSIFPKRRIRMKNFKLLKRKWKIVRKAAGEIWEDPTLEEWPENDYRIFCGDIGNEVTDEILSNSFRKYSSFNKARVVRDKRTGKSKGYGFISIGDASDYIKAMREMNGKYVGNRPIRLKRSTWKDRCLINSNSKVEAVKFKKNKTKLRKNNMLINNQEPTQNNFNPNQNPYQQGGLFNIGGVYSSQSYTSYTPK